MNSHLSFNSLLRSLSPLNSLRSLKSLILLLAAALTFAACSQDDGIETQRTASLQLVSQTGAPETRATSDGTWTGGETVKVNVNGTEYDFTAATDGTLTCATRYWNDYASIDAFARYPANYTFPANQGGGIQAADFIFADKVEGITQSNYSNPAKKLTFRHRTAKVTVTLSASATVPDISGASVTLYGHTAANVDPTTGTLTGSDFGSNEVNPSKSGNTCTALLIPKNYSNEKVLKVTIGNKDYYWKPAALNLIAGNSYALTITVNESGLSVSVTDNGATWELGNTQTVTPDAAVIDVSRSDISGGVGWTYADNTFTVTQFGAYTFTGTSAQNKIKVNSGVTAFITLDNTVLTNSNLSGAGSTVHLQLKNTNSLKGVHIPSGSAITIYGTGSLVTVGAFGTAGIGGGDDQAGGVITINGGTITASGGTGGAGIGGGRYRDGGTITINGGTVTATGNSSSSIGPGAGGSGGTITITGGSVLGTNGDMNPQPKNSSGTAVWRTKLTVTGVSSGTAVTALTITYGGVSYPYNFKDMETGSSSEVYLWLPVGSNVNVSLMAGGQTYSNTNVTVTNNHNNSATLNQ